MSKFNYNWTLADAIFTKDKGKVFSCFACGGGSTMGYKLAGFDVLGFNEIDPKLAAAYIENHKPKYAFIEPIQSFKNREDLPADLYDLDILDGSPPCSPFSDANNRGSKHWGKERVFREGQANQVLDTLFFDFIDLTKKLSPKIAIAENVPGLLFKRCKQYVDRIYKEFDEAGYLLKHYICNSADAGVPQTRKRVFFIALRKDLYPNGHGNFDLIFNQKPISFREATEGYWHIGKDEFSIEKYAIGKEWHKMPLGNHSGRKYHQLVKPIPEKPCNAIVAKSAVISAASVVHPFICRKLNNQEVILCTSYPMDYDFLSNPVAYVCGMSVPPIMMANIADRIYSRFLKDDFNNPAFFEKNQLSIPYK